MPALLVQPDQFVEDVAGVYQRVGPFNPQAIVRFQRTSHASARFPAESGQHFFAVRADLRQIKPVTGFVPDFQIGD